MEEDWRRDALRRLNRATQEMDQIYGRIARRFGGISDMAFWLLYEIRSQGGAPTQSELCKRFQCSKQTLNSAIKRLEARGVVTLTVGRRKEIRLTQTGEALAARIVDPVLQMEMEALGSLQRAECERLLQLMEQHTAATRQGAAALLSRKESDQNENSTV